MNRRFQFAVVASSTCLVFLLLFGAVRGHSASNDSIYNHLGVYSEVLSRIKADYVEEPDMKSVTAGAINGMLESLDPYASYLNAEQYKQYLAAKQGTKAGVGIVLSRRFGYLSVVDALPGSPAAKAGISTGDVIESINNVSTRDMPLAFAQMLTEGDAGKPLELSVLRVRKSEPQKVNMTMAPIVYPAVTGKLMTDQGADPIGVVATESLAPGRAKEIATTIADLEKQGAKRLILDLRHCSTGSLDEGVAVANLFLDKGLITYSVGQKVSRQDYQAVPAKDITKLPVAVITGRGTAGPAEIVAAALLGRRADVVGEHTYGDAAIRKAVTLDDGSAVILSVAKYYSPDGKAIQDTGVTPNILQAEADLTAADLDDDSIPDSAQPAASAKPQSDLILKQAIDAVKKK